MMRRISLLIMVLALTACAGSGETAATMETVEVADLGGEAPAEPPSGEEIAYRATEGRRVIHRATISIEAEDTRAVHEAVHEMVEAANGFVESATLSDPTDSEDQPRITMVIRVPASDLPTTLESIADLGTRVVSQSQQGEDVTEHYIDLEARAENLRLLETELRELLTDVRAADDADPAKLLQVFNEISRVRGEIEQLEGQIQVLDDLTSLATIEVSVVPAPAVAPVVAEGWAPLVVAREALADLVDAFQSVGNLAIRFVVYVLPVTLVVIGLPALFFWKLVLPRLRRRDDATPAAATD